MIGGIAAVELTVRDGSVPVNWLHDSGVPIISSDSDMPPMILRRIAAFGALVGGVMGTMAGGWLVAKSGLRVEESARRWYLPSKGALIGLLILASCIVWIGVLTKYNEQRYRDRLEALDAITKMGGSVGFPPDKDRLSHDASEVDLRDSRLTDAELNYVIALNPQRRLRLGIRITDEGMKKLQHALPNCEIDR